MRAKQLVETFHERFARGDADAIYEDADSDFQQKVPVERHRRYIAMAAESYGTPGPCDRSVTSVKWDMSGRRIMIQCFAVFSRGAVEEDIVWRKQEGQYRLHTYKVDWIEHRI